MKERNLATWKFRLINTARNDPELTPCCRDVLSAALDLKSAWEDRPFLSILELQCRTTYSKNAVIAARRKLESLGYFVPEGRTKDGAIVYEIANPREAMVADLVKDRTTKLKAADELRKAEFLKERAQKASAACETVSSESELTKENVEPDISAGQPDSKHIVSSKNEPPVSSESELTRGAKTAHNYCRDNTVEGGDPLGSPHITTVSNNINFGDEAFESAPSRASNDASGARQGFSSGQRLSIKGVGRCVIMDVGIKRDTQATFIRVRLDRDASLALIPVNSEGVLVQGLLRMEADLPEKTMRQFEWEKRDAA
jgi:hypothetical protein